MGSTTVSEGTGSDGPAPGPAVVYFAKAPRPGLVKTRLCPPLTANEAAGLYAGFLRDVLGPVPGAATYLYGWPEDGLDELGPLLPTGVTLRAQRGAGLWARMTACFQELFEAGHGPVLIRNTDSPDLPGARVREALDRAGPGRVVLGPDAGGGYYLVALSAPCPELFGVADEGGGSAFARTVAKARELGLEVIELPQECDVDVFDDLLALWRARGGGGRR